MLYSDICSVNPLHVSEIDLIHVAYASAGIRPRIMPVLASGNVECRNSEFRVVAVGRSWKPRWEIFAVLSFTIILCYIISHFIAIVFARAILAGRAKPRSFNQP